MTTVHTEINADFTMLGADSSFYLAWNVWTALGVIIGAWLPDLGLDFATVATFIALVITDIKSLPILVSVLLATIFSFIFSIYEMELRLVAALMGVTAGFSV
jgi:predicted branched-subunit amino acid permease